jgi:hypothetical protein
MFLGTITDLKDHWSNHVGRGCLAGRLELRKESKQANKRDQS